MTKPVIPAEGFEEKLHIAVCMPEPDPAFVDQLWAQLRTTPTSLVTNRVQIPWWKKPAFVLTEFVIAGLMIASLISGPQNVLAAVKSWLQAYIPAFGFVDDPQTVRYIPESVRQERDGGVMTIAAGFTDANRTILEIGESHSDEPCRNPTHSMQDPYLMAGETRLSLDGWYSSRLVFPPLPINVDNVVLHFPWILFCDSDTPDWEIPLHFIAAPSGMMMPILEGGIPLEPSPVFTTMPTDLPLQPTSTPSLPSGVTLSLDQVVALQDGILVSGLFSWQNGERWYDVPPMEEITVMDSDQNILPVEALPFEEVWTLYETLPSETVPWALRIPGTNSPDALTLSFPYILKTTSPTIKSPFELELGSNPYQEQTWTPNLDIPFEGHTLRLVQVRQIDDEGKVLEFTFEADAVVESITVTEFSIQPGSGGGGTVENRIPSETLRSTAYFSEPVVTGKYAFTIATLQERVLGPWVLEWNCCQDQ